MQRKNPDSCSVFRSELVAILGGLISIESLPQQHDIWIFSDSRSAIQHLANRQNVMDRTGLDSRSPTGFGHLKGELTHGPDLVLLISGTRSKNTNRKILNEVLRMGNCRRHGGGRVRSTTPAEDRYIVLSAKRNRHTTAQQVANQFLAASGKQISRKTVARRLRGGGLYARRAVVCVPLTRQHRTARLQWCHEHHNWTEQDCACVLFSDESRFSLSSDCRRQLI
ncbi:HTH_Tnp_Tc3_2 domain-containing protein [Trichonephila clavipes]|nr:HTH_Tnp_Tc3_2 domain-containing protein [Trichonephila clavipes]